MKTASMLLVFLPGLIAVSGYFRSYSSINQWNPSDQPKLNSLDLESSDFRDEDELQLQCQTRAKKEAQEELNKKLVMDFYQEIVHDGKIDSISKYIGTGPYIQHNPDVADGIDAIIQAFKVAAPAVKVEVHHAGADGDLVYVHSNNTMKLTGESYAVVDIYRIKELKIVEHWDVMQKFKLFANSHPFF